MTGLPAISAETPSEAAITPFSREAPALPPSPQSTSIGHPLFREARPAEGIQTGGENGGVIGEIEELFRRGIKTREDDDRFWELGCRVSPFMRRMAALLEDIPPTLLFEYPETEKSVGYTVMRGNRLVDRLNGWGEKIVMANVNPTVSAHERTHAIPWGRLTREEQTVDSFGNPVAIPSVFPKIDLPEINPADDLLDITLALVQRMFLDEAMAGLAEVFVANDLVMAGLDPRLIPEHVWEEKSVYDAGGLEVFLASRLYLGDNHKLNYPVAIAYRVAKKIKNGEPLEGIQIADVTGETDPSDLDIGKIWAEVMDKAGGTEKFKQFLLEYLLPDPLKYVGKAEKFDNDGDEMRDAAQVLGGVTERFEALLEKTNDVGALQELLDGSEMERFLAKLNGERLSSILGILLRKAEALIETQDSRVPRFVRTVSTLAGNALEARGYPHAAIEARESVRWIKQGRLLDKALEIEEMLALWKKELLPWKEGQKTDWDGFLNTLEACLDNLDNRFRGKLDASTLKSGLLSSDEDEMRGLKKTVPEILRLFYLLSAGKKTWSRREKNLLGRLFLAGAGVNGEMLEKNRGEWTTREASGFEIETIRLLVNHAGEEGVSVQSRIFAKLHEILDKNLLLGTLLDTRSGSPLWLTLLPMAFLIETPEELEEFGQIISRYAQEVQGWKKGPDGGFEEDLVVMAIEDLLAMFENFESAYSLASKRIGDNSVRQIKVDQGVLAPIDKVRLRINPKGEDLEGRRPLDWTPAMLTTDEKVWTSPSGHRPPQHRWEPHGKKALATDLHTFCLTWHKELSKWEDLTGEEGTLEEFMNALIPILNWFDDTFSPENLDRTKFPQGLKGIEDSIETYAYAALNNFKRRLRPDSPSLNSREKSFCHRLALLAVGLTPAHLEAHYFGNPGIFTGLNHFAGDEDLPGIPYRAESLAPAQDQVDQMMDHLERNWGDPGRLKGLLEEGYIATYPLLLFAFLIEDEGTLERLGKIIQSASRPLADLAKRYEDHDRDDALFDHLLEQLAFAYRTAARRIGYNGKQSGKIQKILLTLAGRKLENFEEFTDFFFYSQDEIRWGLEVQFSPDEPERRGPDFGIAGIAITAGKFSPPPEDKGSDLQVESRLEAASQSLDFGQPLIKNVRELFEIAGKLYLQGRYSQALFAYAIAGHYFTHGFADGTEDFRILAENIHGLPAPDEEKDEVFLEIVEDRIPPWDGGKADPTLWGERMEIAEVLGPFLLQEATPKARKTFLNRLASYANPKEQRLELLSLKMYKRVWKALVLPLVELHPELLEPGFYEHLLDLSPSVPEAEDIYYRALGALFPMETASIDPEADIASWNPRLIEMGAMPAEGVERRLIGEISAHIDDPDYSAEKADKLKKILNAFLRFRINEYIRDVEAKPTEVRYSSNELREIPILDWLYFALDDEEAAQAYAFGAARGEASLADGLAIRATALWDYFEGETESLSPVQAAILDALLTSENLSEARAKLPLYEELMTQEAVAIVWKTRIFEGLKQGGLLSPAIRARYEEARGNREEAERIVAVFSRMLALNEGESPNDFSFAEALRWEEAGRGEIFWKRYERMQEIFRRADGEVLRLRRNDRAVRGDEEFTPDSTPAGKTIFQGTAGTVVGQDHARTRSFFADPANCLHFTHPADLGLLPEYLIYFWGLETPVPKGIRPLEILIKHERSLREKEREMTMGEKFLQIAWAYKILFNVGKFPDNTIPWMAPLPLKRALRKNPEALADFRTRIRKSERRFYETRDAVHESAGGGLPEVFRDLPLLPRFFLMESWLQMTGAERAKRRERIEEITKQGGNAQEVLLAFLEAEGLEKGGQLLFMMYGVLPEDWRKIFGKTLEDNQPATPFEVRGTVDEALRPEVSNLKLEDVYATFEETPAGVGSIAQVHRAVDKKTGGPVAVKVIAGSRANKVGRGMERLERTAAWYAIQRQARFADVPVDLDSFLKWFRESMAPEFDLVLEAGNMEDYTEAARRLGLPGRVPKPNPDRREKRFLEMEWIPNGGKTTPEEALTIARLVLAQMFLSGLTHDDPHPGNVRGGHLLDFGRMERVARDFREAEAHFLVALGTAHDYPGIDPAFFLEAFQKLSALDAPPGGRNIRPEKMHDLENYVRSETFTGAPVNGNLLAEVLRRGGEAGLVLSPKVYVMMKTLMAVDALLRSAGADTSLSEILIPILLRAKSENFGG